MSIDPRLVQQCEATDKYVGELYVQVRTLKEQLSIEKDARNASELDLNELVDATRALIVELSDEECDRINRQVLSRASSLVGMNRR